MIADTEWSEWAERAAIIEVYCRVSREEAERIATEQQEREVRRKQEPCTK